mmetsp:Transcript_31605/g.57470  ORF Transcript_31605/g.57470 Transcript_31605/m.57470 type:complete len:126 (-) Transcript_31605:177-554(-)
MTTMFRLTVQVTEVQEVKQKASKQEEAWSKMWMACKEETGDKKPYSSLELAVRQLRDWNETVGLTSCVSKPASLTLRHLHEGAVKLKSSGMVHYESEAHRQAEERDKETDLLWGFAEEERLQDFF